MYLERSRLCHGVDPAPTASLLSYHFRSPTKALLNVRLAPQQVSLFPLLKLTSEGGSVSAAAASSSSSQKVGRTSEQRTNPSANAAATLHPAVTGTRDCRICQEDDEVANLETPCACSGSLKFAHRKCIQHWCNEKGDTICEICHQPYRSGYSAPQRPPQRESIFVDLGNQWGFPGAHSMELRDPQFLARAAAQRQLLESEYQEQAAVNSADTACCHSAALILMTWLLFRHIVAMVDMSSDEDASIFLMIFLLRAAGFFLPCYIMACAMNMLQRWQQHQVAAITTADMDVLLQSGHPGGARLSMAPVGGGVA